jgi:uncharacterized protein
MKHILIAGGTGLVGKQLKRSLIQKGYEVALLSRKQGTDTFLWDPAKGTIDPAAITWADAIINLAGAGIADERWTKSRKAEIIQSRVQSAEVLAKALKTSKKPPIPVIAASAVGYYGNTLEAIVDENAEPIDQSFMVECCKAWEEANLQMADIGMPTTLLRIGVVLDKHGGALPKIKEPMRFGLAAWFGDGQMWMPWIHYQDLCNLFIWALEGHKTGIFNAVSPKPVRNKELILTMRKVYHPWAIVLPAPAFALRLMLGEMSAVVLNSNHVSAQKVLDHGFKFQYPDLEHALRHMD